MLLAAIKCLVLAVVVILFLKWLIGGANERG